MIHFQHRSRYIWYISSLSPTHICLSLVMDRQGISSPVFDNNDGANKLQHQSVHLRSTTTNARHTIYLARAPRQPRHRHTPLRSKEKGLHRHQVGRAKGSTTRLGGRLQVFFAFIILKAAASKSIIYRAQTRYKRKSSTSTSPWRPSPISS